MAKKIITTVRGMFGPYKNPVIWEHDISFTPKSTKNLDTSQWGGEPPMSKSKIKKYHSTRGKMK